MAEIVKEHAREVAPMIFDGWETLLIHTMRGGANR